jgi:hypothetical protein
MPQKREEPSPARNPGVSESIVTNNLENAKDLTGSFYNLAFDSAVLDRCHNF